MKYAVSKDRIFRLFWSNVQKGRHTDVIIPVRTRAAAALPLLSRGAFDLIYIDEDHAYASVLVDIKGSLDLVREGGYLAGDDLEMQLSGVDAEYARAHRQEDWVKDPESGQFFHPGVSWLSPEATRSPEAPRQRRALGEREKVRMRVELCIHGAWLTQPSPAGRGTTADTKPHKF